MPAHAACRPTPEGRMDLDALEAPCARGDVGTVVLTAGTTGLGAVDRIDEALALRERYGVRIHVDAAYGGFFTLLDDAPGRRLRAIGAARLRRRRPAQARPAALRLRRRAVPRPGVGRLYKHDSPYTYFTSDDLHLGEISLECSRAGAAAAALWLTLRAVDLAPILAGGAPRRARLRRRLRASEILRLHLEPELDIVTYLPPAAALSEIDAASAAILRAGMADPDDPVYLSTLRVDAAHLARHGLEADATAARILRSVLMKPEHEAHHRLAGYPGRGASHSLRRAYTAGWLSSARWCAGRRAAPPARGGCALRSSTSQSPISRATGWPGSRVIVAATKQCARRRAAAPRGGCGAQGVGIAALPVLVDQRAAPHVADAGAAAAQEARERPRFRHRAERRGRVVDRRLERRAQVRRAERDEVA